MMHEAQRLAYLNALGITQYVPLAPIPGAPELPVLSLLPDDANTDRNSDEVMALSADAQVTDTAPVFEAAPVPEVPAVTISSERQIASATPENLATSEKPPAAPVSADIPVLDVSKVKPEPAVKTAPPKPVAATQRFSLAVVTLPQRLRLIVELAQPDAPGFSAREHRVVSDLLLALDAQFELLDSATKLFRWPLVNNPRIAADAGAARDALLAFLAGAQEAAEVPATVFVGSAATQVVQITEAGTPFQLADIPGKCIVTHSLRELEQDWRLKPVVWRHVLALSPSSP